jgi:hypothetical protein
LQKQFRGEIGEEASAAVALAIRDAAELVMLAEMRRAADDPWRARRSLQPATAGRRCEARRRLHAPANNLQQSWRFDWEPPKAVLSDVRTIDWILERLISSAQADPAADRLVLGF